MTSPSNTSVKSLRMAVMLIFLAALPLCLYFSTQNNGFVDFDDDVYVTANPVTLKGLSGEGFSAALGFPDFSYWQPVALFSHQADVSLFGWNPRPMHLLNALLHAVNTLLLFALLYTMTGAFWRSALAAALFAAHPVNADTVAWISERKNLLAVFFWFSAILSYAWYVKKPGALRMIPLILLAALALGSKPVAVTLPFTLLLLDFWPLNRLSGNFWKRVAEKIPLFVMTGAAIALGLFSSASFNSEIPGSWPLWHRLAHVPVAYARYLEMAFWPQGLCAFHPFPKSVGFFQAAGALVLLASLICLAWKTRHRMPYLFFGIFWFLGTLVPSSGLVMAGHWAAVAERYAYAPYAGLFVAVVWGAAHLAGGFGRKGLIGVGAAGFVLILFLGYLANAQSGYWKDSETLFSRCVALYPNTNYFALTRLGSVYAKKDGPKNQAEAERLFSRALAAGPDFALAETRTRMGGLLLAQGRTNEAIAHLVAARTIAPRYVPALTGLGAAYLEAGKIPQAEKAAQAALAENPDSVEALILAGLIHGRKSACKPALSLFEKAARLDPNNPDAAFHYAASLGAFGKLKESADEFRRTLALDPEYPKAQAGLAGIETRRGKLKDASKAYLKAVSLNPKDFALRVNLAQVLLSTGRSNEAISHFKAALSINPGFAPARLGLADALSASGKSREAVGEYEKILASAPDDMAALYGLAKTLEKSGCLAKAAAYYEKALLIRPGWDAVKRLLEGTKGKPDKPGADCP